MYDEQVACSFVDNLPALSYSINAVAQSGTDGYGPAYLVNGLTGADYWYQVGLSYNWSLKAGFQLNYEVFNNQGNSIFPTNGGGGVASFSGAINPGDNVTLTLTFSNGNVIMKGTDQNTGATAQQSYNAFGQTTFIGTPSDVANADGYWTGLMTEWYHSAPYYGDAQKAVYTDNGTPITAAWLWINEMSISSSGQILQNVFSSQTNAPYSFANNSQLQTFSSNGATCAINATQFVTGSAASPVQSSVALSFSSSIQGGAGSSSAPVLTYTVGGATQSATLTQNAQTFSVDSGSAWSVTSPASANSLTERWQTTQSTTGTATSAQTVNFVFYHQYLVVFNFNVSGGGSGYSNPSVTYSQFGNQVTTPTGTQVWADAAAYSYPSTLPGSSSAEQWVTSLISGTVSSSTSINSQYSHQYYVTVNLNPTNGGNVSTSSGWFNAGAAFQTTATANHGWNFENWLGSGQGAYSGNSSSVSSVVTAPLSETGTFYPGVTITSSKNISISYTYGSSSGSVPAGTSNTIYMPSGTTIQITATPSSFIYEFAGWLGLSGGNGNSASVVLNSPQTITADASLNFAVLGIGTGILLVVLAAFAIIMYRRNRTPNVVASEAVKLDLAGLKSLLDSGAISKEEFETQKNIILHPGAAGTCHAVIKLERLSEMLTKGLITQIDYDEGKKKILEECIK
jgi:hypothetical protein